MSDTGPGRFYSPTDFPIVQKLMSGEIKPAAGTTIELGVLGRQHGLPSDGAMAELDQYFAAPTADDFSTRAFVFGEVSAKISGTVSVAADGKITLQNVIIKPFDDHFNFNSDKPHTFGGVTADIYNYVMGPSYHANGNNVPLNMVGTGKVFGDYQIVSAPWYDRLHGVSAYLQPLENANPPSKGNTDNLSPQSPVVQPSYSPPVPDGVLLGTIDSPRLNSQNNQTAFPLPPLSRYARELAGPFRAIPNNYSTQAPGQDSSVPWYSSPALRGNFPPAGGFGGPTSPFMPELPKKKSEAPDLSSTPATAQAASPATPALQRDAIYSPANDVFGNFARSAVAAPPQLSMGSDGSGSYAGQWTIADAIAQLKRVGQVAAGNGVSRPLRRRLWRELHGQARAQLRWRTNPTRRISRAPKTAILRYVLGRPAPAGLPRIWPAP